MEPNSRDPTRLVLREPLHKIAPDRLILIEHVGEDLAAGIDDAQDLAVASIVNAPGGGNGGDGVLIDGLPASSEAVSDHGLDL